MVNQEGATICARFLLQELRAHCYMPESESVPFPSHPAKKQPAFFPSSVPTFFLSQCIITALARSLARGIESKH